MSNKYVLPEMKCVGALGLLCGAMAAGMSLIRFTNRNSKQLPGEDDPESLVNRTYEAQQLTGEWGSVGIGLICALACKDLTYNSRRWARVLATGFTVSRFVFVAKYYVPKKHRLAVTLPPMAVTYITTFGISGLLIFG